MRFVDWEELPSKMQNDGVRKYYASLRKKNLSFFFKRCFDIIVSAIAFAILWPVFIFLAVAIKIDSPGPVFYRQERVTQYGQVFKIHKFRTMVHGADKGSKITLNNDPRITRMGKLIRNCRLDEIAQLIDVMQGSLTLVGTRPEYPKYVESYTDEMLATLLLPAGVTSLTSIYFKNEAKLLEGIQDTDAFYINYILPEKMYYNLLEIERFSFWHDIKVLGMTVCAILGKEYADSRKGTTTQISK